MDGPALLNELAPTAERLFERHLAASKEWAPHELLSATRAGNAELPPGVRAALTVNVLTEDALPYYTTGLYLRFGGESPWWDWIRRWTAEEMRHGLALHDYVSHAGAIDALQLEQQRLRFIANASIPTAPTVADACVYLALQELATRIAHANTARLLPDEAGRRIVARVAADEHLHHLFYRDLVLAALEVSPSATMVAIDRQVRHFSMPGHEIPDFAVLAVAIADAGIYSTRVYLDRVVMPLVVDAWRVADVRTESAPAARARDRLLDFIDRLAVIAPRLTGLTTEVPLGGEAPLGSS